MKKIFLLLAGLMTATLLTAQSPLAFQYQTVVRDGLGTVIANQNVSFRISIIKGTVTGTIIYTEKHFTMTNPFGLVSLEIGKGTAVTGTFAGINWGADRHFINLEMDPNGGSAFQFMGATELLSVPYALHARTVEIDQVNDADADPANELQVLQLSGTQLTLSKGGGTVSLPSTGGGDNWGSQAVVSNPSYFNGNGTTASPLSLSSMGASSGQVLKYNGTSWDNAMDDSGPFTDSNNPLAIYYSGSKKVGIGINYPTQKVTLAEGDNSCYMNIQNITTGYTATDGMLVGMNDLDAWVSTYENGRLLLGTSGSAKMTILSNGDVGIGTSSPAYQLDVSGPVNLNKNFASGVALRCNGDEAIWYNGTYFSWGYGATYNYFSDKVTIGTSSVPDYTLVVNGTAAKTGGGSWSNLSDIRMKNLIGNYDRGLKEVIALQPVRFTYKEDNPRELDPEQEQIGFIAQDVRKIFPEAVNQCDDGYLDFNMHAVNVALVNAVKELKAENDRLKDEINHITAELESRLAKLESRDR